VLQVTPGTEVIFTCDCMVEDVHFLASASGFDVGYKLMVSNVSDIAAMGGIPRYAVVTLVANKNTPVPWLDALYQGLHACGLEYGVTVVGGDTSRGDKVMLSLALLGEVAPGRALLRSNAKVGDWVCLSGPLGGSAAGLELVLGNVTGAESGMVDALNAHFRPQAQVNAGQLISRLGVTCANDISDGLASEAREVAEASGVALVLEEDKIPLHRAAQDIARILDKNPLDYALYGGEDYELLFCASAEVCRKVLAELPRAQVIGLVQEGQGVILKRGKVMLEVARGYTHFA